MPLSPKDVHAAAVVGGGSIGMGLVVVGLIFFNWAYNSPQYQTLFAIEGATFFAVGAVFFLVSVIVLPARHAIAM